MTHLFLLMVLVNGQVESSDMYFYNVHRCNFFANAIVTGLLGKFIEDKDQRAALAHEIATLIAYRPLKESVPE